VNPFGTIDNLPPGCDREIDVSEIDNDASEAFCYVCQDCAAEMRTEATE
jgi:hypothetical protein